ncbi:fungal-specific transcription factor domain-domain-containing protein [Leucosporidium creatinivorum]|uniref:Fungal-specific transcription factor domain-domain-containing protein n=1 Tax=Leucosporidium creatinivorum TaxID=106004 RepID=A0A1Y2F3D4_9BASI|nr:fungal-specific transcription factor domain-domain-containing protein [Leucosporidium creatinivorum]
MPAGSARSPTTENSRAGDPASAEEVELFTCDEAGCGKQFRRRDYLERHQLNHTSTPGLVCHICSRGFHRSDVLKKHVLRHQPVASREPSTAPSSTKRRRTGDSSTSSRAFVPTHGTSPSQAAATRPPSPSPAPLLPLAPAVFPSATPPPPPELTTFPNLTLPDNYFPIPSAGAFQFEGALDFGASVTDDSAFNLEDIFSWLAQPTLAQEGEVGLASSTFASGSNTTRGSTGLDALAQAAHSSPPPPLIQDHPGPGLTDASQSHLWDPRVSPTFGGMSLSGTEHHQGFDTGLETPVEHIITAEKRLKMLEPFRGIPSIDLDSSSFTLGALHVYLELFFLHFAPLYPVLHRPTLASRSEGADPFLLLAMVCLGTAFADDRQGLVIARALHQRIRTRVFESIEDEPRVAVPVLQTLLLIGRFGREYASAAHHDMSQVMHSPLCILSDFSGVFLNDSYPDSYPPTAEGWVAWTADEERRRLGWLMFLTDTGNAALFRHTIMVHSFAMKIPFPCSDQLWRASTYEQWALRLQYEKPQPSFRDALRDLATNGAIDPATPSFSAWILVHGLVSISWTLLWRDLADLSMVQESRIATWKDSLRGGFSSWLRWASQQRAARLPPTETDSAVYWAGVPFCLLGGILLLSETELLRMLAGAPRVAGRLISPSERMLAQKKLLVWVTTPDGQIATWTALQLLQQVFSWSSEGRFSNTPSTTPWCCYIAVVTVWAYGSLLEGRMDLSRQSWLSWPTADQPRIEPTLALSHARSYVARLLSCGGPSFLPQVANKNNVAGVVAYTAHLAGNVPWGHMESPHKELINLLKPC